MDQFRIGLGLFVFLALPPVAQFMESIMVVHMHMQMPMLVLAGVLMAPILLKKLPQLGDTWNRSGILGILLFLIIIGYWLLPRTMDEALTEIGVEVFKFISFPFLAGVPLRDSWKRLKDAHKTATLGLVTAMFTGMGCLYIFAPFQLCNNYLLIDQYILGWAFLLTAIGLFIYLLYQAIVDPSQYE